MSKEAIDGSCVHNGSRSPKPIIQPQTFAGLNNLDTNSTNMVHKAFLSVPEDAVQLMMTPPCFPLPPGWTFPREEDPVPEFLDPFDLDAPSGKVSLGDGTYIEIEKTKDLLSLKSDETGYHVVRRRMITSSKPNIPPLIVDFYDK